MITSRPRQLGLTTISVSAEGEAGRMMGLPTDSLIVLHRIATILDISVEQKIGECPFMSDVDIVLRHVFGL